MPCLPLVHIPPSAPALADSCSEMRLHSHVLASRAIGTEADGVVACKSISRLDKARDVDRGDRALLGVERLRELIRHGFD